MLAWLLAIRTHLSRTRSSSHSISFSKSKRWTNWMLEEDDRSGGSKSLLFFLWDVNQHLVACGHRPSPVAGRYLNVRTKCWRPRKPTKEKEKQEIRKQEYQIFGSPDILLSFSNKPFFLFLFLFLSSSQVIATGRWDAGIVILLSLGSQAYVPRRVAPVR